MIQAGYTTEVPKGFDLSRVGASMDDGLREASHEYRADMESFVMNWVNRPQITQDESRDSLGFTIRIYPTGDNARFWHYVSFGVQGRTITPVRAKFLKFKYQGPGVSYAPKTAPGGAFGGAGKKLGPKSYFKSVHWPGIKARHFEREAIRANQKRFVSIMSGALARGLKAAT